ncbi:MAG TPA: hypothetical protein VF473_10120 [Cyclobacteriaceae bacterium]
MKGALFFAIVFTIASDVFAQKVTVTSRTSKVNNENADGYSSDLDGSSEGVHTAMGKFMKESGKAKTNGDMITIAEPVINGTVYTKGFLYATVNGSDVKTRVWIGIVKNQWNGEEADVILKDIEAMVYRFCIKYYKDAIQVEIDQAQQAADAVTKQTQRTTNDRKQLQNKLTANDQEKIRLEKALEANKLEDLVLKQKIVNNKKSSDSLANAAVKIKAMIEAHKEKQGKVN